MLFGGFTTLINTVSYSVLIKWLNVENVPSVIISWVLSVAFAYITNKLWVFESKSFDKKTLTKEIPSFFGARVLTGILDLAIMYIAVDVCKSPTEILWKLLSNVIVIILNFVASKMLIFKKK